MSKYRFQGRVRYSEIDEEGKITLPGIINYFQDCSTFQSEECGVGLSYLKENNRAWVLNSWQIVLCKYPKMSENIIISTWAYGFKGMLGFRNFSMESESGEMYAYANSNWVYIDTKNMKPQRPPEEEIIAYGIDEKLDMEYAPRKIKKPDEWKTLESFPVRKFHLDTNRHVNNSQYVQMALEVSGLKSRPRQVRVEYLHQAVYQDKIIPRVWENEEKEIVELAGEEQIFALVEFLK